MPHANTSASFRPLLLLACLIFLLPACASRDAQLHRVTNNWCETIRASQVVPIYPLTGVAGVERSEPPE